MQLEELREKNEELKATLAITKNKIETSKAYAVTQCSHKLFDRDAPQHFSDHPVETNDRLFTIMLRSSVELVETTTTERKFETNSNTKGFVIFHVSLIKTLMFCQARNASNRHRDSDTFWSPLVHVGTF